ncbi:MAG TPA: diaminopimelate decarboxylase [Rhodospirillaceae bacterium]|nr:diaminopimelate decarboxylase [Rhodospirillaceae bacterium]
MTKSVYAYRNRVLSAEAIPLSEIAEEIDTPFYCISAKQLQRNYRAFATPFQSLNATIHYAVKANANLAVIRILADCGAGADITSSGELERALAGGVPPEKIVFSGVGKTRDDIAAALLAGVLQINAESVSEIRLIEQVATVLGKKAPVSLRINPNVDAKTHAKTSTGHKGVKFGINLDQLSEALGVLMACEHCSFKGLTIHVGSMMDNYEPFRLAYQRLAEVVRLLRSQGIEVERLDLGGGVSIAYDGQTLAPFSDYAAIVQEIFGDLGCALSLEPGRKLVGDAAVLVTRVVHVKHTDDKRFLIVDAGMNDLVRPAMYGARHEIISVRENLDGENSAASVVGPVCETSDSFGDNFMLPNSLQSGDLLAVMQAGAYGSAMASTYNGRALIPEILVSGAQHAVIRRRIAVAEQMGWESIPDWMVISRAA